MGKLVSYSFIFGLHLNWQCCPIKHRFYIWMFYWPLSLAEHLPCGAVSKFLVAPVRNLAFAILSAACHCPQHETQRGKGSTFSSKLNSILLMSVKKQQLETPHNCCFIHEHVQPCNVFQVFFIIIIKNEAVFCLWTQGNNKLWSSTPQSSLLRAACVSPWSALVLTLLLSCCTASGNSFNLPVSACLDAGWGDWHLPPAWQHFEDWLMLVTVISISHEHDLPQRSELLLHSLS